MLLSVIILLPACGGGSDRTVRRRRVGNRDLNTDDLNTDDPNTDDLDDDDHHYDFHRDGIAVHGYDTVPPYPASHGCVRVTFAAMDYIWVNGLMPMGLTVLVYGQSPQV